MNRKLLLSSILFLSVLVAESQSVEKFVISSSGSIISNSQVNVSFTIGDLVIDTREKDIGILTQGFHQSEIISTNIKISKKESIEVLVFPNPVVNSLNIVFKDVFSKRLSYNLYTLEGKLIKSGVLDSISNKIDFKSVNDGEYLLSIKSLDNSVFETFKLHKNQ